MSYSVNEQQHLENPDSAVPAYRNVYRRPRFAVADLEKNVIFEKELSNGTFKVVDAMPYKQTDLWHDTIFLEGENQSMWNYGDEVPTEIETLTAYKSQLNKKDSMLIGAEVSGGAYFNYAKESSVTAYFKIPKVLSAKYHVAVIVVPKNITNEFIGRTWWDGRCGPAGPRSSSCTGWRRKRLRCSRRSNGSEWSGRRSRCHKPADPSWSEER